MTTLKDCERSIRTTVVSGEMTYREWLIGMCLQGLLANPNDGEDFHMTSIAAIKQAEDCISAMAMNTWNNWQETESASR